MMLPNKTLIIYKKIGIKYIRVREIRRTRRTCPAIFENVRRRAVVKFNQMSVEKLEMSGEAQNNFAYSEYM